MILSNIDVICRSWLLARSLPIHFYSEALFHSATCLRELTSDTLQIINAANLPVGDYAEVNLPGDFQDDLSVCIPVGGALAPLPKQDWITPLRIHDTTTGQFVASNDQTASDSSNFVFGFPNTWTYYWNVNDYGERMGRKFGSHGGTNSGYKLIRERRQIQMTDDFIGTNIILLYISDGQSVDNASQVDTRAIRTIQTFIDWQRTPNAADINSPEATTYLNEKRLLRAKLSDLTKIDILNIFRQGYTSGLKF